MKKIFLMFLIFQIKALFSFGKIYSNTLIIKLSKELSFHTIKLNTFNPVYENYTPMEYDFSKKNELLIFKFNLIRPSIIYLKDSNNLGVYAMFIRPNEKLTAHIFYKNRFVRLKIIKGQFPGDNMILHLIQDSVYFNFKNLNFNETKIENRETLDNYANNYVSKIGTFFMCRKDLKISKIYKQKILIPYLENLKCNFKNNIIRSMGKTNDWKNFFSDSILLYPNYNFWHFENLEFQNTLTYVYTVLNKSEAKDLNTYFTNIQNFYKKNNDSVFKRILASISLSSFISNTSFKNDENNYAFYFDSICKLYHLDKSRYNFPDNSLIESRIIYKSVLDSLFCIPIDGINYLPLSQIFNDTSSIYFVDFWASWCQPCIKNLPATLKLKNSGIDKLKVIFLSIDKNHEGFLRASKLHQLPLQQTFNLTNYSRALYAKFNSIELVPNYKIIFFQNGNWQSLKAHSPDNRKLIFQLNEIRHKKKS